jgi:hypothetical protein
MNLVHNLNELITRLQDALCLCDIHRHISSDLGTQKFQFMLQHTICIQGSIFFF